MGVLRYLKWGSCTIKLSGIFCFGCGIAVGAEVVTLTGLRQKLSGPPFVADWNCTASPYGMLKGVECIGRTPVRHSRDIAESPVGNSVGTATVNLI